MLYYNDKDKAMYYNNVTIMIPGYIVHQPALRALVVFLLSSLADARLSGSFWSPALNTLAVKLLQLDGTSHRGGGSLAI